MREVEAVKTGEQRQQVEAHLAAQRRIYADIWKVGVNTALRISDLLSLTMDHVRALDPEQPALNVVEQKTGKLRKIVVNQTALDAMQRRLADYPDHVWLFQTDAVNRNRRQPPKPINRRSVSRVFERVGLRIAPKVVLGTHSMRKTRGYAMHKAGRSIESIAKVLNHSSPAVTMRYIGLVQQDIDESYTELEL
ncbi:tyrosine-type recombinase/integrase [Granulosicoccus sp.]|nr:tyrosine-type recombinase/integrase [Granulosicoccus sp.]MDB4224301.1 tyrosine-type recombinase/integrase [Granulosicoccus sp.]